ncbi:MAG TPA: hypothetical protein VL201_02730, partial [Patescibacteria group bacterium]|nr:hypothetical protein [Patescibacteria group bacterium]
TQTICIDNGALAQKPPNNAWIEYELLPAITKKTGKIGITDVICLQSSVRSLEIISLLHKHTPLQTIVIPAYHDEASHSSYHVALNRLKNELTNKDSLTVINKADSFNLKIHPQSSIIISSSKQEVASQGKTFLLLQVHGTVGNTHVEMKALKIKKMYSKSFKKD